MEWSHASSHEALLAAPAPREKLSLFLLPTVMGSSAVGMLLLKWSQTKGHPWGATLVGYLLEGFAFAVYPYTLRYHTMRAVTAAWATSSIVTSFVGGRLLYGEVPSPLSACGGLLMVVGVGLTGL